MTRHPALALVLAAALGAAVTLVLGSLADRADAPDEAPAPTTAATAAAPPTPVDPGPARALAVSTLVAAGLPQGALHHGIYPLRGPDRAPDETLPLISFTCPAERGCAPLVDALTAAAPTAGFTLAEPIDGDRDRRPVFRALADDGRPALALRALPPGPRLTLIVGDVGREPALLDKLLALDPDVTFAVMANAPHAPRVAARLAETDREFLAHLPLEPAPPAHADGPDYLTTAADPAALTRATDALLDRVPGAAGADTHHGGRFTPSGPHVAAVLDALAARGLFFVDGGQSDASVAIPTAAVQGVRAAAATHDLDRGDDPIAARLKAIEVSLVLDGHALVTASPDPAVLDALAEWIPTLRRRGIHILRASEIVR